MIRLYVFDADDTLRRTLVPGQPCPHADGEWELLPGVREKLSALVWGTGGPYLGVASNQDHVGYGLVSEQVCRELLERVVAKATGGRARPRIAICPHVLSVRCTCRKPAPGMLFELMASVGVGSAETLFVGNAESDAEAARRAGVRFVWAWEFFGNGSREAW